MSAIVEPGKGSPRGLSGGVGTVGVVAVIGTIGGFTSKPSDAGEVAGGGGMATVVAAGDWGVLSHPEINQQPSTIIAHAVQAWGPADFFMMVTLSGALTHAVTDDGRNAAALINPC